MKKITIEFRFNDTTFTFVRGNGGLRLFISVDQTVCIIVNGATDEVIFEITAGIYQGMEFLQDTLELTGEQIHTIIN
jgi:hypothetical protein